MSRDPTEIREWAMQICGDHSRSTYNGSEGGAHLECLRNSKETTVAIAQKTRARRMRPQVKKQLLHFPNISGIIVFW